MKFLKKYKVFESLIDEVGYISDKMGRVGGEDKLDPSEQDMLKVFRSEEEFNDREEHLIWIKYLIHKYGGSIGAGELEMDQSIYMGEYTTRDETFEGRPLLIIKLGERFTTEGIDVQEYVEGTAMQWGEFYTISWEDIEMEILIRIKNTILEGQETLEISD